jgi:hypothetical protein
MHVAPWTGARYPGSQAELEKQSIWTGLFDVSLQKSRNFERAQRPRRGSKPYMHWPGSYSVSIGGNMSQVDKPVQAWRRARINFLPAGPRLLHAAPNLSFLHHYPSAQTHAIEPYRLQAWNRTVKWRRAAL